MGIIAGIIGAISSVAGIVQTVSSLSHSGKDKGSDPVLPPLPNQDTADKDAKEKLNKQRRTALATGGQTDYTGGGASILDSSINKVSLVGG